MEDEFRHDRLKLNKQHWCEVCSLDEEEKRQAFSLYISYVEIARIAEAVDVRYGDLESHALAYGWDIMKSENTPGLYRYIMRKVLPIITLDDERINDKFKAKDVINAARQLDLIQGREQAPRSNERDMKIIEGIVNDALNRLIADGHTRDQVIEALKGEIDGFEEIMQLPSVADNLKRLK